MANVTRNTYQPKKNYKRVTAQRGNTFVDNETNELQDILGEETAEGVRNAVGGTLASGTASSTAGTWSRLVAELGVGLDSGGVSGWEPVASGTADIVIKRGVAYVDGWRAVLAEDTSLVAQGLTFPTPGADTYGIIYVEATFGEVDAAGDPLIATAQLGETSVRHNLVLQFKKQVSTVSYDAALDAIANGAPTGAKTLKQGNTARFVICRWFQANAQAVVNAADIVDLRTLTTLGRAVQKCFRILRARQQFAGLAWIPDLSPGASVVPDVAADGMVAWNAFEGRLVIGTATSTAGTTRYDAGLRMRTATSPKHNIANTTGVVRVQNGGATADGTQIAQDVTKGWLIGDEQALGFVAVGYTTAYPTAGFTNYGSTAQRGLNHHFLHTAPSAIPSNLPRVGMTPEPGGGAVPKLLVQQPVVANYSSFSGGLGFLGPDAVVICYRDGDDLVWWNGHVTRGTQRGWTLDSPNGESMADSDALISSTGRGHVSQGDAVERALAFLTQGGEAGAFGSDSANARSLRLRVRKGVWLFTRKIHEYGLSTENVNWWDHAPAGTTHTGCAVAIIGDGPGNTELRVEPSNDAAETAGLLNFNVGEFTMKGVTLRQDTTATANNPRYSLAVYANDILLENCTFVGPVYLSGRRVRVRNCRFLPLPSVLKTMANASFAAAPYVACGLYLQLNSVGSGTNYGMTHRKARVEDCIFNMNEQYGVHGALILDTSGASSEGSVVVKNNRFEYNYGLAVGLIAVPSILVHGSLAQITIERNVFAKARGIVKKGIAFTDAAPPFNGLFGGSPIGYVGGLQALDGTSAAGTKLLSLAYVTCTGPRHVSSSLRLVHNDFDLASVGAGTTATGRAWPVWGAFIHMPNPLSQAGGVYGGDYTLYNITFSRNHVRMTDFTGSTTWSAPGTTGICPATWGFFLSPTFQNNSGSALNLKIQNVNVEQNTFEMGGVAAPTLWRSMLGVGPNATGASQLDTTVKYMLDTSCPIGIVLKKAVGAAYSASGRSAGGVVIRGNNIVQASSPPAENLLALDAFITTMRHQALMIHVALGDAVGVPFYTTGNVTPDVTGALSVEAIDGAVIADNNIFMPGLAPNVDNALRFPCMALQGLQGGSVRGNTLHVGYNLSGARQEIRIEQSIRTFIHGNVLHNAVFAGSAGNRLVIGENGEIFANTLPVAEASYLGVGTQSTDYFLLRPRAYRASIAAISADSTKWTVELSGSAFGARQLNVAAAYAAYIPIVVPTGTLFRYLYVFVKGASVVRAALPATRPVFRLVKQLGFTMTTVDGLAVTDNVSGSVAEYEAAHIVRIGPFTTPIGQPKVFDQTTALTYWLYVEGETGANSVAGYTVTGYEASNDPL